MEHAADVIVVGAGVLGASTAYHLMREGKRVTLLDRGPVAAETSSRAAGLGMQIQADDALSSIARLGVAKLMSFEADTGQALVVHQPGSIKVARTASDEKQLHHEVRRGQALGVDVDYVSTREASELAPWFKPGRAVRAMWYAPQDVYLEAAALPRAYTNLLRAGGADVRERAGVAQIGTAAREVTHVVLDDGTRLEAGEVVLAAGAWLPVLAETVGLTLPLYPTRHQLLVTRPMVGVTNLQPAVRVMDAKVYVRPCSGGLMLGAYEADPLQIDLCTETRGFSTADLPLDGTPLRAALARVAWEVPGLAFARWRELRGGLPTMTPDGHFLAGPVEALDRLWVIGGCNAGGLAIAPALGMHLARWIAFGERHEDLAPFDPGRFGDRYEDDESRRLACLATYAAKYSDAEVWCLA